MSDSSDIEVSRYFGHEILTKGYPALEKPPKNPPPNRIDVPQNAKQTRNRDLRHSERMDPDRVHQLIDRQ